MRRGCGRAAMVVLGLATAVPAASAQIGSPAGPVPVERLVARRAALLDSIGTGIAVLRSATQRSVEGDPIISYIRVHANGTVEIFVDARADRFKSADWTRLRCDRIMPVADANEPPDLVYADDMVFVEDGCEALPLP